MARPKTRQTEEPSALHTTDSKRDAILKTAARLFAQRPFHEVRLDDVAQAAHIGKGTVYLYFKSKDDLFASLLLDAYSLVVQRATDLAEKAEKRTAAWRLEAFIRELVTFAKAYPHVYSVMRDSPHTAATQELRKARESLGRLAGRIIADGVKAGEFDDPRPAVTGQFVPACVRSAIVFAPESLSVDAIVEQVMRVIGRGIQRKKA
ncbi:MAG: TetR/AcrR family transcriptional regulator [Tepidisphaeraceae bacterium]